MENSTGVLFTLSDLQYDTGGVLFDTGVPIYISDLQYEIGVVPFDIVLCMACTGGQMSHYHYCSFSVYIYV